MTTTVPTTQSVSDPEYNQILQVFDCLEDDVPLEIQNIQQTVTVFKGITAREKRSKLLKVLVGDVSDPVLALALACTSRSDLYHTHTSYFRQVMKLFAMLLKPIWSMHSQLQRPNLPIPWRDEQLRKWIQFMLLSQQVTLQGRSSCTGALSCRLHPCSKLLKE